MDYRLFGPGTTVWFPVSAAGALFFLGDCHAVQGDGEIVGTGIETTFEVTVRLTVEKRPRSPGRAAKRRTTSSPSAMPGRSIRRCSTRPPKCSIGWRSDYGLDKTAASHLLGQVVRYDVGNVFDPAYTMACRVAKKWLTRRVVP